VPTLPSFGGLHFAIVVPPCRGYSDSFARLRRMTSAHVGTGPNDLHDITLPSARGSNPTAAMRLFQPRGRLDHVQTARTELLAIASGGFPAGGEQACQLSTRTSAECRVLYNGSNGQSGFGSRAADVTRAKWPKSYRTWVGHRGAPSHHMASTFAPSIYPGRAASLELNMGGVGNSVRCSTVHPP